MKKIDTGQTFQILANAGVVLGILLLVYELSLNRQMMRAQVRSDIANTLVHIQVQTAASLELEQATVKAVAGEPLTPAEAEQYADLQGAFWSYRANVYYQYRNGLYEESEYFAQRSVWSRILNTSDAARTAWCRVRDGSSPEFIAEIDALLEKPCG